MSFFDKKQDVIDIQLTQFGKNLLSKGKFKPVYYSFFDDDILYDGEYASLSELGKDVTSRIKNETPLTKVQHVYHGLETEFRKIKEQLRNVSDPLSRDIESTVEKSYAASAPLGTSDLTSENAPAWEVNLLKGEYSGSISYKSGSHANVFIPQLTVSNVTYYTYPQKINLTGSQEIVIEEMDIADGAADASFVNPTFPDGTYIKIESDYLLLSVDEKNAPLLKDNFDIEVFIEEIDPNTSLEVLTPLYFGAKKESIDENNILLDQENDFPEKITDFDPSYVNHYFDVFVDEEINREVICKTIPKKEREARFPPEFLDCEDQVKYYDSRKLYDSDITVDDIDDDC